MIDWNLSSYLTLGFFAALFAVFMGAAYLKKVRIWYLPFLFIVVWVFWLPFWILVMMLVAMALATKDEKRP